MSYTTVRVVDEEKGEVRYELVHQKRLPIDVDRDRPVYQRHVRGTRISVRRSRHIRVPVESPSQDARIDNGHNDHFNRGPKTLGDTNEFISAFWVNGKPKCREGYRYDFRRKMCRLIK